MCGNISRRYYGLLLVVLLLLWPIFSAEADHVLTDEQYNKLEQDLTELGQITQRQQTVIDRQQKTLDSQQQTIARQQQTISNSQASLDAQAALLPTVSKSFEEVVKQARIETNIWRTLAFTFFGGLGGYVLDGGRGALIGSAAGIGTGGVIWLFGK